MRKHPSVYELTNKILSISEDFDRVQIYGSYQMKVFGLQTIRTITLKLQICSISMGLNL
jgi:hypothetical protein